MKLSAKPLLALTLTITAAAIGAISAQARPARCQLTVDGATYIDGTCDFSSWENGSFQISSKYYFAQVNIDDNGEAQGYWNEEKGATHAHTPLGRLTRNDACWVNERAIVCAK